MGVISNLVSGILDIYENTRSEKKSERKRDYTENSEYKFSGSKKDDFVKVQQTPTLKKKDKKESTIEKNDHDDYEER